MFFVFLHLIMLMLRRSQLDFLSKILFLNVTKQDNLKNVFFFQNEYVGDFASVIDVKEIIFLNLFSSIESGP